MFMLGHGKLDSPVPVKFLNLILNLLEYHRDAGDIGLSVFERSGLEFMVRLLITTVVAL